MKELFKQVKKAIQNFERLQNKHLETFKQEELPDLEKQSEERNVEISQLMEYVNQFVKLAEKQKNIDSAAMMFSFNEQITALLDQNKVIETKVRSLRSQLKNGMKQVSKGKQAIGSYRSSAVVSNQPRVLSIKN